MQKYKLTYHPISAKTGDNIENLFFNVVDMINENQKIRQKKFKLNEDDQTNNGPMTDKPLKAGQITESANQQGEEKVKLTDNTRKRFLCC